jgi:hypothetical protein
MRSRLIAVFSLLYVSCALTREEALSIATREVARRNLPLPKGYSSTVTLVQNSEALASSEHFFEVDFQRPQDKKPLYIILIDQYSHRVDDFILCDVGGNRSRR